MATPGVILRTLVFNEKALKVLCWVVRIEMVYDTGIGERFKTGIQCITDTEIDTVVGTEYCVLILNLIA